jgi:perosamine synthetase
MKVEERGRIKVVTPVLGQEELENVVDVVKNNWLSWTGAYVKQFERDFASYIGTKHAVATTSCTTALHLAIEALGIGKGDEVLMPAFTFIATANSIHYSGAKPVFVEADPDYWCIDPKRIEEMINKRTKAIIVVHMFGHPCDMDPIMKIAKKHGLHVIEDCAQAHGAEYKGRKAGSIGIISCFSFDTTKMITTGEGGICLTDDKGLFDKMCILRNNGFDPKDALKDRYKHKVIGFNYRMTNLQAAVGVAQIKRLPGVLDKKRWIASSYRELFKNVKGIKFQKEMPWAKSAFWSSSIVLKEGVRDSMIEGLEKNKVETRPAYYALNQLPMYKSAKSYPISESLGDNGICLPSGIKLTKEEIIYVAESVKKIVADSR